MKGTLAGRVGRGTGEGHTSLGSMSAGGSGMVTPPSEVGSAGLRIDGSPAAGGF